MESNIEIFKKINKEWMDNKNELEDNKYKADIRLYDGESENYKGLKIEFIGYTKEDSTIKNEHPKAKIEYTYNNQHHTQQDFEQGRYESQSFYLFIHAFTYGLNTIIFDIGKKKLK